VDYDTDKMQYNPEKLAELCESTKQTYEESIRITSEIYETYKDAKKQYKEVKELTSSDPDVQAMIERTKAKCKTHMEETERYLQKSARNMECCANVMKEAEELAMVVVERYKN